MTRTKTDCNIKGVNGKSVRQIAVDLGISASVVSQTIAGIYTGKEETKQRVLDYVNMLKLEKIDFNLEIYPNLELFGKVIYNSIKDRKYKHDETKVLISLYDKIIKINNTNNNEQEK